MKTSRRRVLKTAATVAAFTYLPRHVLGGPKFVPPSEKINVALIGAGGMGRSNLRGLFNHPDVQVIAVADPAETWDLEGFYYKGRGGRKVACREIEAHYAGKTPNYRCAEYEDFRVMLEREKAIDAVLCATPDHLHAIVSVLSMRAGKHVYCEKPLTHNIWEARHVAEVARQTRVATQMGNQGHSNDSIRQACEWIWDGAIGTVGHVHAWVGSTRWNSSLTGRPTEQVPVPQGLNWDLWLGPREHRPYHPAYAPFAWRDFWAFGGGTLGDFGCHDLDVACWALGLRAPKSVEAFPAGAMDSEIQPHGEICHFDFEAQGDQKAVKVTWYGGGLRPPTPEGWPESKQMPTRGTLFVGEKGMLFSAGAGGAVMLLPEKLRTEYRKPAPTIPRSKGHHRDWLDAIKGGAPASSNFEYGARLTEIALLGVASLRTGSRIVWDPQAMKAAGVPQADAIFREPYRAGWELA